MVPPRRCLGLLACLVSFAAVAAGAQNFEKEQLEVDVNVRAIVDRILSRYPNKFAMFREMIQNANDAEATSIEFDFRDDCSGMGVEGPCMHVQDDGKGFADEGWKRLVTIASGNPDPNKVGGFGVGFYSVFGISEVPVVRSRGTEVRFTWTDDTLEVNKYESGKNLDGKGSEFILKLENASRVSDDCSTPSFLVYISRGLAFTRSLTKITVKQGQLFGGRTFTVSKERDGAPAEVAITPSTQSQTPDGIFEIGQSLTRTAWKFQTTIDFLDGTKKTSGGTYAVSSMDTKCLHHGKDNDFTKFVFSKTGKKVLPATAMIDILYRTQALATPKCNSAAEILDDLFPCAMALHGVDHDGKPTGGQVFVGFETPQQTGTNYHINAPFFATMDRESIEVDAPNPIAKFNEDLLFVGGAIGRSMYTHEVNSLFSPPIPNTAEPSQAENNAVLHMETFTSGESQPKKKVGVVMKSGFVSAWEHSPVVMCLRNELIHACPSRTVVLEPMVNGVDAGQFLTTGYLPNRLRYRSSAFVKMLRHLGLLRRATAANIVNNVALNQPMAEQKAVALMQWLISLRKSGKVLGLVPTTMRQALAQVNICNKGGECTGNMTGIDRYASVLYISQTIPVGVLPPAITAIVGMAQLESHYGLNMMMFPDWWDFATTNVTYVTPKSEQQAVLLLQLLTRFISSVPEEGYALLKRVPMVPTDRGTLDAPIYTYFQDVHSKTPLLKIHESLSTKHDISDTLLKSLGVRTRVHIASLIEAMIEDRKETTEVFRVLAKFQDELSDDEWEYLKTTNFLTQEGSQDSLMAPKDLYLPTEELKSMGLPVVHFPGFASSDFKKSANSDLLKRIGVQANPTLTAVLTVAADHEKFREKALGYLTQNLKTLYKDEHVPTHGVDFLPTDQGMKSPSECFMNPNPLNFPVLSVAHRSLGRALELLKSPPLDTVVNTTLKYLRSTDTSAELRTQIFSHAWSVVLDEKEDDRKSLREKFENETVVPAGEGELAMPKDSFVGSAEDLEAAFTNLAGGVTKEPTVCAQSAQQYTADYGKQANEFLWWAGAPKPEETAVGADFFGLLLKNKVQQFQDDSAMYCCVLSVAANLHSDISHLSSSVVAIAFDQENDKAKVLVQPSQCYFLDSNKYLFGLTKPRYLCVEDGIPQTCQASFEKLGSKSLTDAVTFKAHQLDSANVGASSGKSRAFLAILKSRAPLVAFALRAKMKYSSNDEQASSIIKLTQDLLSTVEVKEAGDLKEEIWFEEKLLKVQETSAMFDSNSTTILINGASANLANVASQLASAIIQANWDTLRFNVAGSYGVVREFAQTIYFVCNNELKTLEDLQFPVNLTDSSLETVVSSSAGLLAPENEVPGEIYALLVNGYKSETLAGSTLQDMSPQFDPEIMHYKLLLDGATHFTVTAYIGKGGKETVQILTNSAPPLAITNAEDSDAIALDLQSVSERVTVAVLSTVPNATTVHYYIQIARSADSYGAIDLGAIEAADAKKELERMAAVHAAAMEVQRKEAEAEEARLAEIARLEEEKVQAAKQAEEDAKRAEEEKQEKLRLEEEVKAQKLRDEEEAKEAKIREVEEARLEAERAEEEKIKEAARKEAEELREAEEREANALKEKEEAARLEAEAERLAEEEAAEAVRLAEQEKIDAAEREAEIEAHKKAAVAAELEAAKAKEQAEMFSKEGMAKRLRLKSSKSSSVTTLGEYVTRLQPGQTEIFMFVAANEKDGHAAPVVIEQKKKGIEVLFVLKKLDEHVARNMGEFEGHLVVFLEEQTEEENMMDWLKDTVAAVNQKEVDAPKEELWQVIDPRAHQELLKHLALLRNSEPQLATDYAMFMYDAAQAENGQLANPEEMLPRINSMLESGLSSMLDSLDDIDDADIQY
jgi:hypothetical protein